MVQRLIQKVADCGAQRFGENKCRPEQRDAADVCCGMRNYHSSQQDREHSSGTDVAEPACLCEPVSMGRAEGLRDGDGDLVEPLGLWLMHRIGGNWRWFAVLSKQGQEQKRQQQR